MKIKWEDMKVGQTVRLISHGDGHHRHWDYELLGVYTVANDAYGIGPADGNGHIPEQNWAGWIWELVV